MIKILMTGQDAEDLMQSFSSQEKIEDSTKNFTENSPKESLTPPCNPVTITESTIALPEKLYQKYQQLQREGKLKPFQNLWIMTDQGQCLLLKNPLIEKTQISGDLILPIDPSLNKILSRCLLYQIPVPIAALEAVCKGIDQYKEQLHRAIGLGLIEVKFQDIEGNTFYQVSRSFPSLLSKIPFPSEPEIYPLYQKAWAILTELWGHSNNYNQDHWQEIFRLKLANKDNLERFRGGFFQMLAMQENAIADISFEQELRKHIGDLAKLTPLSQLESFLQQKRWKEADQETAWIFYQLMVLGGFKNFYDLCLNIAREDITKIDQLWMQYSEGKFGFTVQKQIWENVGGTANSDEHKFYGILCDSFSTKVQWQEEVFWGNRKDYDKLQFSQENSQQGELPAKWITRRYPNAGWTNYLVPCYGFGQFLSKCSQNPSLNLQFSGDRNVQ